MSKLVVGVEMSVDGAMGGEHMEFFQQVFQYHSEDVKGYLSELLFMPEALIMGRLTYEAFAAIWPTMEGKDADHINALPKYVASRTLKAPLAWNATLIEGDVVEAVRALKQAPGNGLLQYGVGELTHTLLQAGLVDEVRLMVYPFTFGKAPHVFAQMGINALELLETKRYSSGAMGMHYRVVGETVD